MHPYFAKLLLIPQRYEFSSKSQQESSPISIRKVVADTTKVRIFKQITTLSNPPHARSELLLIPQRYEFSSKSQLVEVNLSALVVVADTTKVRIFKQITTVWRITLKKKRCCWYHKGTNFQANHNIIQPSQHQLSVVADTTKVRIFKQITTNWYVCYIP